eukprot:TRINITY_DN9200_c0_g2_i1.p3 TRINITY_DN9200_c0_g2~~TRINITY_DN9200_c0_g2_i1.p3  ORF type:complete len:102 (-),score=8.48 TRINITY_DN9200_c0_g2_i1:96-401(-)
MHPKQIPSLSKHSQNFFREKSMVFPWHEDYAYQLFISFNILVLFNRGSEAAAGIPKGGEKICKSKVKKHLKTKIFSQFLYLRDKNLKKINTRQIYLWRLKR